MMLDIVSTKTDVTLADGMQAFMSLRQQAKNNGVQDLTLDEINTEINASRNGTDKMNAIYEKLDEAEESVTNGDVIDAFDALRQIRKKHNI